MQKLTIFKFQSVTWKLLSTIFLSVCIIFSICVYHSFAEVPCKINYQGRLIQNNKPVNIPVDMEFKLYTQQTGGEPIKTISINNVPVHNGLFRVVLDLEGVNWAAGETIYLEVKAGTDTLTPREPIYAYPYAINSHLLEGSTKEYFLNTSTEAQTKYGPLNIMGNVGIGTSAHQGKLHIVSDSTSDPYVFVTSHTTTGFGIVVSTSGNVGIGTTEPEAKLEVAGNLRATGGIEPDWDSGWVRVDRINQWGLKTLTHNLNYFPRQIQWWFSNGNPGTFIGPLASNTYKDHAGNPLGIWITLTQVKFSIWHDRYVYRMYNASTRAWSTYNNGYYRFLLWK